MHDIFSFDVHGEADDANAPGESELNPGDLFRRFPIATDTAATNISPAHVQQFQNVVDRARTQARSASAIA